MLKGDFRIGLLCYCIALFYSTDVSAIERAAAAGAREAALSQSVVALPGLFSVFHNQAFLADQDSPSLGISYRQPYFIPGYTESALSAVLPVHAAVLALGITQSAFAEYAESGFGLSISKRLTSRLSAGLFFNTCFASFPEAGTHKGAFQVDGGVKYSCNDQLTLGFHLKNLVHSKIETFQYNLAFPVILRGGASYRLTDLLLLSGEAMVEEGYGTGFRYGTEFSPGAAFLLRGGISTNPFQHSVGFGYLWKFFQVDFAMVHHYLLGYSPFFSLNLLLK